MNVSKSRVHSVSMLHAIIETSDRQREIPEESTGETLTTGPRQHLLT